jgi:hypothetical protein
MAIDATIAAGQPPQPLLQGLAQATGLRGQMLQQNQLTQQMGANQATSQAMQQAYDPATGKIDMNKLTGLMSQDPRAAYNLLPTQNAILENQQKQLGLDSGQFDLALKRTNYLQGQLGSLMQKPNLSGQDFINMAAEGVKSGLFPADQAVRTLQSMPQDPSQLKDWGKQLFMQQADNASRLQMMMPQNSQVGTGDATHFVSTDPITGRPTDMGQMQQSMAPGDANSLVPVYNDVTGQMDYKTKQQVSQGVQQPQQQGSTLGLPGTGSNGRYPSPQGQGQMPGGQSGFAAGPALGAAGAADVMGKGSAEGALNLQSQASGAPDRIRFMQDMTQNLEHFNSGPAAGWTAQAKALGLQLAPGMAQAAGVDPESVANKEEFTKYAAQLAMNSMKGMGSGTDSQLATTVSGNPHADLSKLGLQQILQVLTGTERATMAKNQAWQQAGVPPQNYGKWESTWNAQIDPRVFVTPEMSQAQVATMYKGLKAADQARFKSSLRTAIDAGIIPNPAVASQAQAQ